MNYRDRLFFILIVLILTGIFINIKAPAFLEGNVIEEENFIIADILRIIDGDTVEITNGTVRLLGINTPEKNEYLYNEAKQLTENLAENQTIKIFFGEEKTDKYNRMLGFVFIEDTSNFLNCELLKNGLAHTFYLQSLDKKYLDKLNECENYAKNKNIGIWEYSNEKYVNDNCLKIKEFNYIEENNNPENEFVVFENSCKYKINFNEWLIKDEATHIYKFNDFILNANSDFYLITGLGKDTNNKLYQNQKTTVWNDDGDQLFLRDKTGKLVVYYQY